MITEDEEHLAMILAAYLECDGYERKPIHNGESALQEARKPDISLLIMDVMLPKVLGYEVRQTLRRESQLPVILLTPSSKEHDRLRGFELGGGEINKPVAVNSNCTPSAKLMVAAPAHVAELLFDDAAA